MEPARTTIAVSVLVLTAANVLVFLGLALAGKPAPLGSSAPRMVPFGVLILLIVVGIAKG